TDLDGAFVFAELPPGIYFLEARLPGFAPLLEPNLRVRSGQITDTGVLAPTWLAGAAPDAIINGKVEVSGGKGSAAGGEVAFLRMPGEVRVELTTIGVSGDFTGRVPPGVYTLRVSHPTLVTANVEGVVADAAEEVDLSEAP